MKKASFIIASIMFVAVASVNAQEVSTAEKATVAVTETKVVAAENQEKTKITKDELPQAIKTTLAGDDFKGWEVVNAYKLTANQYEVELKNGAETKTFKFDAEGKVIVE